MRGVLLISYETNVCTIDPDGWLTCTWNYSATTRRHIGAFLKEEGRLADYHVAKKCFDEGLMFNTRTGEYRKIA